MKFPFTITLLLLLLLLLCSLTFSQRQFPPNSEWPYGKNKEIPGIDVPEGGGNWRSRPKCMTSRPYYVGYGRWRQAMQGAACLAAKRDDAWIISPHRIDSLLCKYSTTIFLVNDNDFNVTVPFPVIGQVAMDIVRACSDHDEYVNGEEDFIAWGKRLTVIIAWRDCPGDPDW